MPSSLVAAVTRSGTITIVTSSATARPLMPVRADSEPANLRPVDRHRRRRGLLQRVDARLEQLELARRGRRRRRA